MAAGLGAAIVAACLQYWGGLPPALMSEDMYAYIGRIAAEPVGWTCVALLIGHIRSRQIANTRSSRPSSPSATGIARRSPTSASICARRTEMLERHIAANAPSSNIDVAEAVTGLESCDLGRTSRSG